MSLYILSSLPCYFVRFLAFVKFNCQLSSANKVLHCIYLFMRKVSETGDDSKFANGGVYVGHKVIGRLSCHRSALLLRHTNIHTHTHTYTHTHTHTYHKITRMSSHKAIPTVYTYTNEHARTCRDKKYSGAMI